MLRNRGCCCGGVPFFCRGFDDTTACADFPRTMHFTDSVMGSCVLTYSGSFVLGWTGTFIYHNPGCTLASNGGNPCPARDVTISVRFYREGVFCVFNIACNLEDTVPGTTKCAIDGPFTSALGAGGTPATVTCSPFHTSSSFDLAGTGNEVQAMYALDTGTVTLTVTS